jgi:RimJ/RimL family protein N-acetyltransferase
LAAITASLDHLRPWMPWVKDEPTSLEQKVNLLRRFRGQFDLGGDYVFGIFNKSETELIGSTGLHTRVAETAREIGYWIHSKHIGKGLATETVSALTKVGFEIEQLSHIEIHCSSENLRSQRVPEKLGYKLQPNPQQPEGNDINQPTDKQIWIMSKADYHRSPMRLMQLKAFDILEEEIAW